MKRYDIIFISGSHGIYGGGQVYLQELNKKINTMGFKSVILSSDNIFNNSLHIPRVDTWKFKLNNYFELLRVLKKIDCERNAKIITNDITLSMVAIGLKLAGWKVYPLIHMSMYNTASKSMLVRKLYPFIRSLFIRIAAKRILSVNKENDKLLGQKTYFIGNFTINSAECNYSQKINRHVDLLYVGRFDAEKQPIKFVQLVESLIKKGRNIKAVMIGSGSLYDETEKYILDNDLSGHIQLTGFIPKEKICCFYKESKLLVITSKTEGLPTVILDSAAYGMNFISPALGSIPYLNNKWSVGHIVDVNNMDTYIDSEWEAINRKIATREIYHFARDHTIDVFVRNFLTGIENDKV